MATSPLEPLRPACPLAGTEPPGSIPDFTPGPPIVTSSSRGVRPLAAAASAGQLCRTRVASEALDACEQLVGVEWLDDLVIGAQHQFRHSIERFGSLAGEGDDRDAISLLLPEVLQERVAARAGKLHVQEDKHRQTPRDRVQCILCGCGLDASAARCSTPHVRRTSTTFGYSHACNKAGGCIALRRYRLIAAI